MNNIQAYEPVVKLTRGGMVECVHYGAAAVADADGKLVFSLGDPLLNTFPRSSMKPFQVLPFVERGGVDYYGMTEEELAICCASHHGTDEHVRVIQSLHAKSGLNLEDLQCGMHMPSDKKTAERMRCEGIATSAYRHNCSGKHSGMLAHAVLRGLPKENYLSMEHPVQQSILETVAQMCHVAKESLVVGTDGCSAPVFAMPLYNFAWATAQLCQPDQLGEPRLSACKRITQAMRNYPMMIAGPKGFDTILMEAMQGKVVSKGGAEGYQLVGVMPGARYEGSKALGIALKISDGDGSGRARSRLILDLLSALGFEEETRSLALAEFNGSVLRNWRGLEIGEIRSVKPIEIEA